MFITVLSRIFVKAGSLCPKGFPRSWRGISAEEANARRAEKQPCRQATPSERLVPYAAACFILRCLLTGGPEKLKRGSYPKIHGRIPGMEHILSIYRFNGSGASLTAIIRRRRGAK